MKIAIIILWIVCVGVVMEFTSSCVVAPPIEKRPEVNHAPIVDYTKIQPEIGKKVTVTEKTVDFIVSKNAIYDPDGDNIYYFWLFHDFNQNITFIPFLNKSSITFDPCFPYAIADGTTGVLELMISDRDMNSDPKSFYDFPDDAHFFIIAFWPILIQTEGCQ